ncbi:hypothetical protein C8J56DRAFT_886842 [Mycena floridula]|nr:hypothetical protein C8J56DRAFT_886842 [Mycena floridula]
MRSFRSQIDIGIQDVTEPLEGINIFFLSKSGILMRSKFTVFQGGQLRWLRQIRPTSDARGRRLFPGGAYDSVIGTSNIGAWTSQVYSSQSYAQASGSNSPENLGEGSSNFVEPSNNQWQPWGTANPWNNNEIPPCSPGSPEKEDREELLGRKSCQQRKRKASGKTSNDEGAPKEPLNPQPALIETGDTSSLRFRTRKRVNAVKFSLKSLGIAIPKERFKPAVELLELVKENAQDIPAETLAEIQQGKQMKLVPVLSD